MGGVSSHGGGDASQMLPRPHALRDCPMRFSAQKGAFQLPLPGPGEGQAAAVKKVEKEALSLPFYKERGR